MVHSCSNVTLAPTHTTPSRAFSTRLGLMVPRLKDGKYSTSKAHGSIVVRDALRLAKFQMEAGGSKAMRVVLLVLVVLWPATAQARWVGTAEQWADLQREGCATSDPHISGRAILHSAAIFFVGSRSASRAGRSPSGLDPRIQRLRAPLRGIERSPRYGRDES